MEAERDWRINRSSSTTAGGRGYRIGRLQLLELAVRVEHVPMLLGWSLAALLILGRVDDVGTVRLRMLGSKRRLDKLSGVVGLEDRCGWV